MFAAAVGFVSSPTRPPLLHSPTATPLLELESVSVLPPLSGAAPELPNAKRLLTQWSGAPEPPDALLALVAPDAFQLLREWRRNTFGDEAMLRSKLQLSCDHLRTRLGPVLASHITARTKGLWSAFGKSAVRGQSVHDTLGLRIVVADEAACFAALREVQSSWPSLPGRAKDYVHWPKPNGYQALHDTVLLPCGTPLEVQVRSTAMHWHAELGGASHRRYKERVLPTRLLAAVAAPRPRPLGALGQRLGL